MNKIVNKFLLTEGKFIPELDLRQARFTDSALGQFAKHGKGFKNVLKHLYGNKLDKTCFAHDDVHPDSKYLAKRTMIWKDRAYEIARKQDQE